MDLKQIIENIKGYIESKQEVTVFQVMAETGCSYLDVCNTIELCVREGMVTKNGDKYVLIPKNKRVSLKEQMNRKILKILNALSDEEIEFLKDATDKRTRSMVEIYCKDNSDEFLRFFKHFRQIQLFTGNKSNFKLTLNEAEYLHLWELLGDYPKKKGKEKSKMRHAFPIHRYDRYSADTQDTEEEDNDDDEDEETTDRRIKEARKALERRKAEILRRLEEESEEDNDDDEDEDDLSDLDEIWYDNSHCVITEIQRHMRKNKMHSRLELINDIKNTLTNKKRTFQSQFLEKAIINLVMMSDEDFERIKKQFCG